MEVDEELRRRADKLIETGVTEPTILAARLQTSLQMARRLLAAPIAPVVKVRKRSPDASGVDAAVGARLRAIRNAAGLSQIALGGALGVSFQQIQKYEKGTNGISASRLFDLAVVLAVPVEAFFGNIVERPHIGGRQIGPIPEGESVMAKAETQTFVRAYYKIDATLRRHFYALVRSCAADSHLSTEAELADPRPCYGRSGS